MKTLFPAVLVWLPLAAALAQAPPRDLDPVLQGAWPGFPRGPALDVAVSGDYVYVAGAGLHVFDISDRARPRRLGGFTGSWDLPALKVVVADQRAFVADVDTLHILDLSRPADPRWISQLDCASCRAVAVHGDFAYAFSNDPGLEIFDISDPAKPRQIARIESTGQVLDVALSGGYAYVAGWPFGLNIFDLSDPAEPRRVSGDSTSQQGNAVAVVGPLALLACGHDEFGTSGALEVIDISDRSNPRRVGGYRGSYATDIAVSGHYAYLLNQYAGVEIIDFSDPTNPQPVGGLTTPGQARGIAVSGDFAYLADGSAGLQVVDLSNPAEPEWVGGFDTGGGAGSGLASGVAVSDGRAFLADGDEGLQVIDLSHPDRPRRVENYQLFGLPASTAFGYVADAAELWRVTDLRDPAHPKPVGGYKTIAAAFGATVAGHYAYVLSESEGLRVLDLTNPAAPRPIGEFKPEAIPRALAVSGNCAYLAEKSVIRDTRWVHGGLKVIDVSDPANPRRVGGFTIDYPDPVGLAARGNYVYLADAQTGGDGGLLVFHVSNPATPVLVTHIRLFIRGVKVSGPFAFVSEWGGLLVYDLADPANPRRVGRYSTNEDVRDAVASGSRAFLAVGRSGLRVLDLARIANPQRLGESPQLSGAGAAGLVVSDQHAFAIEGTRLHVLDISDPKAPRTVVQKLIGGGLDAMAVSGDHAYAVGDGFTVLDVSNPAAPGIVHRDPNIRGSAIAVAGDFAFLAGRDHGGLTVLNLSNPVKPQPLGHVTGAGYGRVVAVSNLHAYVAVYRYDPELEQPRGGLGIFDVRDPAYPREVGRYETAMPAEGLTISGGYLYLVDGDGDAGRGSLHILDLSDPVNPRKLGRAATLTPAVDVAVSASYAYIATGRPQYLGARGHTGVEVLDVSNPAAPRRVSVNSAVTARVVAIAGDKIVVAGDDRILSVLNRFVPLLMEPLSWNPGEARLSLTGPPDWPVRIQRGVDLSTWQDWQSVTTRGATPIELTDPEAASQPQRFYRAVAP